MAVKGLLLRLSALDADAATAVRVIAHFQALLGSGALDAISLARSTAGLAECAAGLELPDGRTARFGPGGAALPGEPEAVSQGAELGPSGRVWLERPGPPGPFDELILEWMAIAARTLCGGPTPPRAPCAPLAPRTPGTPGAADPALMELVLSERESDHDRARALRLLGLAPELPLRMVAVRGAPAVDAGLDAVALLGRAGLEAVVRVTRTGPWGTVLVQPRIRRPTRPPRRCAPRWPTHAVARTWRATRRAGCGSASAAWSTRWPPATPGHRRARRCGSRWRAARGRRWPTMTRSARSRCWPTSRRSGWPRCPRHGGWTLWPPSRTGT
ncbi:hypothetical protein SAZ11_10810 [Streptomyces sp. FXJ1.4098]|nr:hypothetical protein [Streptomyces sp. FXJ1.4098]